MFDEVDRLSLSLDPTAQEFAALLDGRLLEMLERSGVEIISCDSAMSRQYQRLNQFQEQR